ncbi:fumarate hydratase FumD [Serratia sp. MF2]|uniref:fumarate hydratase FumD n=1 Tax=Serratia sp. MF2 TaxID=3059173 RepID=UPI0035B3CE91
MYTKDQDELYDEMCRVVGDVVFTMSDFGIESKQIVIADMLRTSLAHKDVERPELLVKAMELAIKTLEK